MADDIRRVTDPGEWGYSLANLRELLLACLEAISARSVLEIGAYRGELTRPLLEWAATSGARVAAIEPEPPDVLEEVERDFPELQLVRKTSHEALPELPITDVVILDGDHNYYTLRGELRLLDERAPGGELPLLVFHDVGWPHARRDTYYDPDQIPAEERQPLARDAFLAPDDPGVAERGLPFRCAAAREGGDRNGVLTAIEDFQAERDDLRLALVPLFFGMGVAWSAEAPWAEAIAEFMRGWDRHPVLERAEANRVSHLVARLEADELRERVRRQEEVLRAMLGSRALAVAERLSRLNQRGQPVFTRDQVRRALGEEP